MFRNREFRHFSILYLFMAAVSVTLGFALGNGAGVLALLSSAAFGAAFFIFTKTRYKNIAQISSQIDLVLHDAERLYINQLDEGELSILNSEITKMTLRIREQNEALKREKCHLADSLADIAHQLRTPLTSANLILSLLADETDADRRKTFVRELEELLVKMDWLITSLLKISRLDAGIALFQNEKTDVNAIIHAAVRPLLIPMELHGIDLQIDAPKGIFIQGDSAWLSEAVQNILKNCMESAGENGKIEITCADTPLFTQISIHDSGPGFLKEEDLACLFDRFYRGKNANTAGYGIGLALCKMIITRQGGAVTAKNHAQGGALFVIHFPK
ncbi:sensor histidine kinase [Clostridium sp. MCC353]|uniref:sensor histidine kinase n=1 Tax=Clostridium sp. MCC353 TaxID=2592646 RepID=UPI001C036238|nr:HAMP domain-containing sensor histidine kinase [Clostridium sp. MCC353]MBT9778462.1 sensor histidine kinase [Clostridium sp. MCC353]